MAAEHFGEATGVSVFVASDPELVAGRFEGDHAGKYELSQLLYLRPELATVRLAGACGTRRRRAPTAGRSAVVSRDVVSRDAV